MADTKGSELFGALAGEVLCPDFDVAGDDRPHSRQYLAEFLLAVAGNAGDAKDLAGSDFQRYVVQRDIAGLFGGDLASAAKHGDAVGNFQDLVEFVADEDDGVAAGDEFAERLEQF